MSRRMRHLVMDGLLLALLCNPAGASSDDIGHDRPRLEGLPTPSWEQIGSIPLIMYNPSAIYDPVRNRMVVFNVQDVWVYSSSESPAWMQLVVQGNPPRLRSKAVAIYDSPRDRMVLFGGEGSTETGTESLDDVWALSLSDPPTWTQIQPGGGLGRYEAAAIYDPVRDRMIVHGGGFDDVYGGRFYAWPDAQAFDLSGVQWSTLPGSLPRAYHALVYDPIGDRMLLFGGDCNTECFNDGRVSSYSLSGTPGWSDLGVAPTPVAERSYVEAVYDESVSGVVAFGGRTYNTYSNELWLLSLSGTPAWTQFETVPPWPGPRVWHTMVQDPVNHRTLMFGGWGPGGARMDLWQLTWNVATSVEVPNRPSLSIARARWDPASGGITVTFTLTSDRPARLDLVDVAGRRIASERLVGAAGEHVVVLATPQKLPSGTYFARLSQGDEATSSRALVIR